MTSTEIALRQPNGVAVTERDVVDGWITVVADVAKLSDHIAETDFVPKALRNKPAAIAACILTGRELGIGPMASLKSIHMVQGVPSLSAEYKRARALAAGHQIVIDESNSTRCVVRGRRAGAENWVQIAWTLDQARKAKLAGKEVWQSYPQRMLQARATSELCDLLFPDATLGLPTTEELEDGGALALAVGIEAAAENEPAANGHAPAAPPRTAQRRQRAAKPDPAPVSAAASASGSETTPQAAPARTARPARTDAGLPPLPGEEDEPGPTRPGSSSAGQDRPRQETSPPSASSQSSSEHGEPLATGGQVGIIQSHFKRLDFGDDEREQRLQATALIAGRPGTIASTKELTQDEAKAVADTLSRCRDRERLIVLLAQQQEEEGQDSDE